MNAFARSFSTALMCSFAAMAVAQAPIVRQPPSDSQPQYSAPPAEQQGQPQYPQPAAQPYDQQAQQPPAPLPPAQLDRLVNRIALYPDPLLAQTLTAATYWDEIPDAAAWADQHSYLHGDALNAAMQADNLPWDPSVLALLPFPGVLDMMARDPDWTGQLGNAVLVQDAEIGRASCRERVCLLV